MIPPSPSEGKVLLLLEKIKKNLLQILECESEIDYK